MRGVKSDDLLAIVDFLYRGEANVFQENLDSFLAVAEELQLKGLTGKTEDNVQDFEEKPLPQTVLHASINTETIIPETSSSKRETHNPVENRTLAIPSNFSGDLDDLEEMVKSMMEKSSNKLAAGRGFAEICKVCGKEGMGHNIKDHIEANHLEGIVIPCNFCEKTFRSRNSLRVHKIRQHPN